MPSHALCRMLVRSSAVFASASFLQIAAAQIGYPEIEPNNSKAQATPVGGVNGMNPGDFLFGETRSTSLSGLENADIFLIRTAAAPLGIYRYRLMLDSQNPPPYEYAYGVWLMATHLTDCQSQQTVGGYSFYLQQPQVAQWYGFGRQERVYWYIGGSQGTPLPYTVTLEREAIVNIASIGPLRPGPITFTAESPASPLSIALYDHALVPETGVIGFSASVTETLPAGLHFLAVGFVSRLYNNPCPTVSFTGEGLDFPDGITSYLQNEAPLPLGINDSFTSTSVPVTVQPFEVRWLALRVYAPHTCGSADFDGDGSVGTSADIEAFFACLAGNCCLTCDPRGADFDGDGAAGTDADIEAFFRVLAGGAC